MTRKQENKLYEILVPTFMDDKPVRTRYHRVWDNKVRAIAGGLTIFSPAKGQWISGNNDLFCERMIPVRIMCTAEQIEKIAEMTIKYYRQEAVMYYKISDEVRIKQK